jgi:hypothetical protein
MQISRKASTTYYPTLHLELARYIDYAIRAGYELPYTVGRLIGLPPPPHAKEHPSSTQSGSGKSTPRHQPGTPTRGRLDAPSLPPPVKVEPLRFYWRIVGDELWKGKEGRKVFCDAYHVLLGITNFLFITNVITARGHRCAVCRNVYVFLWCSDMLSRRLIDVRVALTSGWSLVQFQTRGKLPNGELERIILSRYSIIERSPCKIHRWERLWSISVILMWV